MGKLLVWWKKMHSKKGFTLTELIVVVAILGILSGIAAPSVLGYIASAQVSADQTNAATIQNAATMFLTTDPNVTSNIGTYIDANGSILVQNDTITTAGPNDVADYVRQGIAAKLSSSQIPAPKQSGCSFFLYNSGANKYAVVAWKSSGVSTAADANSIYKNYNVTVGGVPLTPYGTAPGPQTAINLNKSGNITTWP